MTGDDDRYLLVTGKHTTGVVPKKIMQIILINVF